MQDIIFLAVIFCGAVVGLILSLRWQKKGLAGQQQALSHVDVSLELQRKSMELQEAGLKMAEETLRQNSEIIALLTDIRAGLKGGAEPASSPNKVQGPFIVTKNGHSSRAEPAISPVNVQGVKKISDYTFYSSSWQLKEIGLKPQEQYTVVKDVGGLRAGERVEFIGFDDVDNHYGIFVFTNSKKEILEVSGDFSGSDSYALKDLKSALLRV